jgi:hypothetical protein
VDATLYRAASQELKAVAPPDFILTAASRRQRRRARDPTAAEHALAGGSSWFAVAAMAADYRLKPWPRKRQRRTVSATAPTASQRRHSKHWNGRRIEDSRQTRIHAVTSPPNDAGGKYVGAGGSAYHSDGRRRNPTVHHRGRPPHGRRQPHTGFARITLPVAVQGKWCLTGRSNGGATPAAFPHARN